MASYSARVKTDAARWVQLGFIDRNAQQAIIEDAVARDRHSLSFGTILAIMAALLFAAAILIFVAANWETIPRLWRVGALFAIILGGYVGGAMLKLGDHGAIGDGLWLIAAAAFGGSIALIGQMYHLSGDETQAILTWCIGTAVAAAALRSGVLTMAAVGLASSWLFFVGVSFWRNDDFPHFFLVIAAVLWVISFWTRSAGARHLLLLSLIFYGALLAVETNLELVASALAVISAMVFAAAVVLPAATERIARVDGLLPVHALIGFLTGIFMIQLEIGDDPGAAFPVAAAIALAGIVAAVVLAGRESRGLRWIAYAGFGLELCLIYTVMIQGMLGTAGFFLLAGTILGLLAIAIIRIEKRLGGSVTPEGLSS